MSDLVAAAGQMVAGAVVQEFVSRAVSLVLGKRKEKASQGEYLERLTKAVHEVEFMLERTAKLPITEVSLLRHRFELKRDFIKAATCLLSRKRKKRQDTSQVVAHSSSPRGLLPTRSRAMFSVSSSIATTNDGLCLSCDDVDRFERLAVSAQSILTRVESGCSLRRWMYFPSPLVRHLLDRKTLLYRTVQSDQQHRFEVWPAGLEEERGVEAVVQYMYWDCMRPAKSFFVRLLLRISESTDIVGIAIKCLQSMASQFNLVTDTATGQLTLLASNLQDISYSHAPPWDGIQEWHNKVTQTFRPDPLCCKAKGHTPCANKQVVVSSQISLVFPEEVISFRFQCYISALEYSLRSSADARGKRGVMGNRRRPPLKFIVCVMSHYVHDEKQRRSSYILEEIGDNGREPIDVSTQQIGETVRSRAINCFLRQPKVKEHTIGWWTKHGGAVFMVEKLSTGVQVPTWV